MCITQHTGPTALRPIRRTKQLWLSVLLEDTSAAIGQAGIRTHILTTPELESNALDHSAMTLQSQWCDSAQKGSQYEATGNNCNSLERAPH